MILDQHGRTYEAQEPKATPNDWMQRRFEAAKTDRLTGDHWQQQQSVNLNLDIMAHVRVLRKRCAFEIANNSFFKGIASTHSIDIVGKNGPSLQLSSKTGKRYAAKLESLWRRWCETPDVSGRYALADLLQLNVIQCWTHGEFIYQRCIGEANRDGIQFKINAINPERLDTPTDKYADEHHFMGIEIDPLGKPLAYYINQMNTYSQFWRANPYIFTRVPARDMIHYFEAHEPGQMRGIPWATPVLQVLADLRDFDQQVLDAARAAAGYAMYMYSNSPGIKPVSAVAGDTTTIQRNTMRVLPAGWDVKQAEAKHPSANYVEYRAARLAELGRMVNMPAMLVMLDSSKSNYSSARFDGQRYDRSNQTIEGRLERRVLNQMLGEVERESQLRGILPPMRPSDLRANWGWAKPPHVDPLKEGQSEAQDMQNGVATLVSICTERGIDWEQRLVEQKQVKDMMLELGLDSPANPMQPTDSQNAELARSVVKEIIKHGLVEDLIANA